MAEVKKNRHWINRFKYGVSRSGISLGLEVFSDLERGLQLLRSLFAERGEKDIQEKPKGTGLRRSCPWALILPHPNSRYGKLSPAWWGGRDQCPLTACWRHWWWELWQRLKTQSRDPAPLQAECPGDQGPPSPARLVHLGRKKRWLGGLDSGIVTVFTLSLTSRKLTVKFNVYLVASAKNIMPCVSIVFPT